jgi:transposase
MRCEVKRQHRRKFSLEFKREAVKLCRDSGKGMSAIARELGIRPSVLSAWISLVEAEEKTGLSPDELEELKRLRKENERLKTEVEILGKATAFFANRSR